MSIFLQSSLHKKYAFTLVELLLYIALAGGMLIVISTLYWTLIQAKIKNQTIAEVGQQGIQTMQIITQAIRNAEAITIPTNGDSGSTLSLSMSNAEQNPTIFDLSNGTLRITEGVGSAISLTSDRVIVSNLTFENISRIDTPGTIQIQLTLTHTNPGSRNEYDFTKTFTSSASLRFYP